MILPSVVKRFINKPLSASAKSKEAFAFGAEVPKPTFPFAAIYKALEGAPGIIRNGSVPPFVLSFIKKLASFPDISQLCGVQPKLASCCKRKVGVLPYKICNFTSGSAVPKPIFPLAAIKKAFAVAPAKILKGIMPAVASSIPK